MAKLRSNNWQPKTNSWTDWLAAASVNILRTQHCSHGVASRNSCSFMVGPGTLWTPLVFQVKFTLKMTLTLTLYQQNYIKIFGSKLWDLSTVVYRISISLSSPEIHEFTLQIFWVALRTHCSVSRDWIEISRCGKRQSISLNVLNRKYTYNFVIWGQDQGHIQGQFDLKFDLDLDLRSQKCIYIFD